MPLKAVGPDSRSRSLSKSSPSARRSALVCGTARGAGPRRLRGPSQSSMCCRHFALSRSHSQVRSPKFALSRSHSLLLAGRQLDPTYEARHTSSTSYVHPVWIDFEAGHLSIHNALTFALRTPGRTSSLCPPSPFRGRSCTHSFVLGFSILRIVICKYKYPNASLDENLLYCAAISILLALSIPC